MNDKLKNGLRKLVVVGGTALAPVAAFAQTADPTAPIIAKITEYSGYAVALVVAFALAIWGLRAAGLLKRGG